MSDKPTRNLIKKFLRRCDMPGCWKRGIWTCVEEASKEFTSTARYEFWYMELPVREGNRMVIKNVPHRYYRQCDAHGGSLAQKTQ